MVLHSPALPVERVLDLAEHHVEGVVDRRVAVLVLLLARDDLAGARRVDVDMHLEEVALRLVPVDFRDDDVAARDAWVDFLDLRRQLVDARIHRGGVVHAAVCDLWSHPISDTREKGFALWNAKPPGLVQ
jgi:hypothetical protein